MERVFLRAEEVAKRLQISRAQAYMLIRRGQIPSIRLGRSVRVPEAALDAWIAEQLQDTMKPQ